MPAVILVFKKGFSTVVKGVQCDVKRIDFNDLEKHLSEGWKVSIEALNEDEKPKRKRRTKAEIEAEKEAE